MGLAQHLQGQLQRNSALLLQPPVSQRQPAVIPQQPTSMQSSMAAAGREQVEGNVWSEDQLRQQRLLGMGSYGKVYAATITSDPLLQVAVKYWKTGRPLPPQESVLKHVKVGRLPDSAACCMQCQRAHSMHCSSRVCMDLLCVAAQH
jgi:hypothetical protein